MDDEDRRRSWRIRMEGRLDHWEDECELCWLCHGGQGPGGSCPSFCVQSKSRLRVI